MLPYLHIFGRDVPIYGIMVFVGVALAESTAIYGLVIAILLITRLG